MGGSRSEWAESHDKDGIWCLLLLFHELSSVLLWTDPGGCHQPCPSSSHELTQLWWRLFGGLWNQNLRRAIRRAICDSDPLCASSLTLPKGRETYVKISFGFGCFSKCLSGQMVPPGKGMLWSVSCPASRDVCLAAQRAEHLEEQSASVSQRWRLEKPPECTHKNPTEFKPPGWQKTAPCGRAVPAAGWPQWGPRWS